MAQVKLVAESLEAYVEGKELNEALLEDELNEGSKERYKVASALAQKDVVEASDIEKYGSIIDSIIDKFSAAQPGKAGDPEIKAKKKIKAEKAKFLPLVTKFMKVYKEARDSKKAAVVNWNPNTKKLDIRVANMGKSSVGSDLGQ